MTHRAIGDLEGAAVLLDMLFRRVQLVGVLMDDHDGLAFGSINCLIGSHRNVYLPVWCPPVRKSWLLLCGQYCATSSEGLDMTHKSSN